MLARPQSTSAARIPSILPSSSLPTPNDTSSSASTAVVEERPPRIPASSLADTTGLAHDARNLLGALGLYCDLLSVPGVLRPEHQHYASELRTISESSSRLIQRLLALPISTSTPAAQDQVAMLCSLAPVLQRIASGTAAVTVTAPASLPPLPFSSEIIERIAVNLVRNAVEAIRLDRSGTQLSTDPPEGEIHVTLAAAAGQVQLSVEDNGPGLPPAIAAAYLDPTLLDPTLLIEGAIHGLGHRIVRQLVTASAGQLSLPVHSGRGTIFCIQWPIPGHLPTKPRSSASAKPRPSVSAKPGPSTATSNQLRTPA